MNTVKYDLSLENGKIKPMNAVNNGPAGSIVRGQRGNIDTYAALEIPYARNHDASFYSEYGGEHTVDVHRIFKNFDADETDPASYVFEPTDQYVASTFAVGTKVFYRLGATIEHGYKYGTRPPKDFNKWARICEHIIRHYTEGWADGFNYDIEYWEIWNEPDCRNGDGSNPCWQGTEEQFIDLYEIAAKHLKACFPNLKIGGPAFCSPRKNDFITLFLNAVSERDIPLDFYSFHGYIYEPSIIKQLSDQAMLTLGEAGIIEKRGKPELFYNEWNYVRSWTGEEYKYSRIMSKKIKGASLIAGAFCVGQMSDIDMMMYYDARPSSWCGLFDTDTLAPTKPYYSFYMFKDLVKLGTCVAPTDKAEDIYTVAAKDGKDSAILLTYYNDNDETEAKQIKLEIENAAGTKGARIEYYLLDDDHDVTLVREETFTAQKLTAYLDMKLFDTYLLKIKAL